MKKRIEYGKKVTQSYANGVNPKRPCAKSLSGQPALTDTASTTTNSRSPENRFMTKRLANSNYGDSNNKTANSSHPPVLKNRMKATSTKSTGSSLDYYKFDESRLEELRMRHELGMQYVNKLVEEMKL